MKTINYTGSSKLISRIVNLLNRKAPLPLDGNDDPDWGSNGQVLSTDGNGNTAWVNQGGGGSGGHTIENTSGADLPQEDNLQFADAKVTDDSGNSRTKVEVIRPITESQVSSISEDGVYVVTDGQQISINAADVVYNGGSVAGALNDLTTNLDGLKVIKFGKIETTGNNISANTQYRFDVTDANIKATDILLTQLYMNGANTNGVTASRCDCINGGAYFMFLSSISYTSSVVVGYKYIILRF